MKIVLEALGFKEIKKVLCCALQKGLSKILRLFVGW